jgi:osmotically-inducible protein OsmY
MDAPTNHVQAAVRAELARDERLPHADAIAIGVEDGVVTLRGTVGSPAQRHAAVAAARRPEGVSHVNDQLKLELLHGDRVADAQLAGRALQRQIGDREVPAGALDVEVDEGWLTLKGVADSQLQSDSAFDAVAALPGVLGVTNEVTVVQPGAGRRVSATADEQVRENVIT